VEQPTITSERHWPNMVDDADGDQPPTWVPREFHEQDSSQYNFDQSIDPSQWWNDDLLQVQFDEIDRRAARKDDIILWITSLSTLNEKDSDALQYSFQPISPPAAENKVNEDTNARGSIINCRHDRGETIPGIEVARDNRRERELHQNITMPSNDHSLGEVMCYTAHHILDQGLSMKNTLLNTPARPNVHENQLSAMLRYSIQSQDPQLATHQLPTTAQPFTSQNQQQMSYASMGRANGNAGVQAPAWNHTSLSDMSWRSQSLHRPRIPTSTSHPVENGSWNVTHQQQSQSHIPLAPGSNSMTQPSYPFLGLQNPYAQRNLNGSLAANESISITFDEQFARLLKEISTEVRLHLHLLNSYYSHVLKYSLHDNLDPRPLALRHWVQSAEHWESAAPEAWKARIPKRRTADVVKDMLLRQTWIHTQIETSGRRGLGVGLQQLGAKESQVDIRLVALQEQGKVMGVWTRMFQGMLGDLRYNFPLFEDTLEEFYRTDNWRYLDVTR
jgi:hypothetical protein